MHYLVVQITFFLVAALVTGLLAGWWLRGSYRTARRNEEKTELQSLRRNLEETLNEKYELRARLKNADEKLNTFTKHYSSDAYGEYLEIRKQLEESRKAHEMTHKKVSDQEIELDQLREELLNAKNMLETIKQTQAEIQSKNSPYQTINLKNSNEPMVGPDDLKQIKGIGNTLEKKLYELGIMSYKQIASFTSHDIDSISKLLQFDGKTAENLWKKSAQELYVQKYGH